MGTPHVDIESCRLAHDRLRAAIAPLTDADVRRSSLLPGWSIGHVLTHLARNADSVLRRLDGATRGEIVDQYPGGMAGRRREIEAGSSRPARELVLDVMTTSTAVDDAFASLPTAAWKQLSRSVSGDEQPVEALPVGRWREVEVHLTDLGLGSTPADWPIDLVTRWLPDLLAGLPSRTDAQALVAWLLGRGGPPDIDPY